MKGHWAPGTISFGARFNSVMSLAQDTLYAGLGYHSLAAYSVGNGEFLWMKALIRSAWSNIRVDSDGHAYTYTPELIVSRTDKTGNIDVLRDYELKKDYYWFARQHINIDDRNNVYYYHEREDEWLNNYDNNMQGVVECLTPEGNSLWSIDLSDCYELNPIITPNGLYIAMSRYGEMIAIE